MKNAWLLAVLVLTGCGIRPVFGPPRVVMTIMGSTVIA